MLEEVLYTVEKELDWVTVVGVTVGILSKLEVDDFDTVDDETNHGTDVVSVIEREDSAVIDEDVSETVVSTAVFPTEEVLLTDPSDWVMVFGSTVLAGAALLLMLLSTNEDVKVVGVIVGTVGSWVASELDKLVPLPVTPVELLVENELELRVTLGDVLEEREDKMLPIDELLMIESTNEDGSAEEIEVPV